MKKVLLFLCVIGLTFGLASNVWAILYTGSINSADFGGMFATGEWDDGRANLSWEVDNVTN